MAGRKLLLFQTVRLRLSVSGVTAFVLLCALLLLVASSAGCRNSQNDVDKQFESPTEQKKARLLGKIEKDFSNAQAHYELGKIYQDQGNLIRAEEQYMTAISFDPAHREAQAGIVKVMLNMGDETQARFEAERYIRLTSVDAIESLKLALAFQHQQLDEYALTCYRQALNLAPNSAKVNRQIGYYYLSKGDKERAKDYLTRSYQINPYQPEVAGELGRLGVEIKIPTRTKSESKKLDKMIEEADEELLQ